MHADVYVLLLVLLLLLLVGLWVRCLLLQLHDTVFHRLPRKQLRRATGRPVGTKSPLFP